MRIKHVLAFFGAVSLSSLALAEPSLPGSLPAAQEAANPAMRFTAADAANAAGNFKLEDGRMLKLISEGSTVFMELKGRQEELVPVSKNQFVGRHSGTQLTLDAQGEKVELTQFRR